MSEHLTSGREMHQAHALTAAMESSHSAFPLVKPFHSRGNFG